MLLLVAIAHLAILAYELPRLQVSKGKRDMVIFMVIWVVVSTLNLLMVISVKIPSPIPLLNRGYELLGELLGIAS